MRKQRLQKIIGVVCYAAMFLPLIALKSHHNCHYNECFFIFSDDRKGICVEKAIDDMYMAIAIIWWCVIYGSAMTFSKSPNSTCPFVIIGLIIAISIYGAFIDPSKCFFVAALLLSVIPLIVTIEIDKREIKKLPKR
jgi:hypothetical protein